MGYKLSRYAKLVEIEEKQYLFNMYSGALGTVLDENRTEAKRLFKNRDIDEESTFIQELIEFGLIIDSDIDEDAALLDFADNVVNNSGNYELLIIPTWDCNFRCQYCYEQRTDEVMDKDIQDGIIKYVKSNKDIETLKIGWFGGEPLLCLDTIKYIMGSLSSITKTNEIGLSSDMSTNGFGLVPDTSRELIEEYGVNNFQITVDGFPEYHNRMRPHKSGTGTYRRIFDNLTYLKNSDMDFNIAIRSNFDRTVVKPEERIKWIEYVYDNFMDDDRFEFNETGVHDDTLEKAPSSTTPINSDFVLNHIETRINKGKGIDFAGLFRLGYICYGSKKNNYVIAPDGSAHKCAHHYGNKLNRVGHITPDGNLSIDLAKEEPWIRNYLKYDEECFSCYFAVSCLGNSCPAIRIIRSKRPCLFAKNRLADFIRICDNTGRGGDA